jgi:disulfide oxidoreductase YuzD
MKRRFGDSAGIEYVDTSDEEARAKHVDIVAAIHDQGLLFPVTFIDGVPVYDGAVSYPAIMRAVEGRLAEKT